MTGSRARPWCQPSAPSYATGSGADVGAALAVLSVSAAAPSPTAATSTAAARMTGFLFTVLPSAPRTHLRFWPRPPAPAPGRVAARGNHRPGGPGAAVPVGPERELRHDLQGRGAVREAADLQPLRHPVLEVGHVTDDADHPAPVAQVVDDGHHLVEGVRVQRAEALVDEQGVEVDSPGLRLD